MKDEMVGARNGISAIVPGSSVGEEEIKRGGGSYAVNGNKGNDESTVEDDDENFLDKAEDSDFLSEYLREMTPFIKIGGGDDAGSVPGSDPLVASEHYIPVNVRGWVDVGTLHLLAAFAAAAVIHLVAKRLWRRPGEGEGSTLMTKEEWEEKREKVDLLAERRQFLGTHGDDGDAVERKAAPSSSKGSAAVSAREGGGGTDTTRDGTISRRESGDAPGVAALGEDNFTLPLPPRRSEAGPQRTTTTTATTTTPSPFISATPTGPMTPPSATASARSLAPKLPPPKSPPPPPAQILFEALSSVVGSEVTPTVVGAANCVLAVNDDDGTGSRSRPTWSGIGWKKRKVGARDSSRRSSWRKNPAPNTAAVVLDLIRHIPPHEQDAGEDNGIGAPEERERDWLDLYASLDSILLSPSTWRGKNPLRLLLVLRAGGGDMTQRESRHILRTAASWHSACRKTPQNFGLEGGCLSEVDRTGLTSCLAVLGDYAVRECAARITEQIVSERLGDDVGTGAERGNADEEDVELSLFEDDFDDEKSLGGRQYNETDAVGGVIGALLSLLDLGPMTSAGGGGGVSGPFLVDLIKACDDADAGPIFSGKDLAKPNQGPNPTTADILLCLLLSRLPSPEDTEVVQATVMLSRLASLSNVLIMCPPVARALSARLGKEAFDAEDGGRGGTDGDRVGGNGRALEESSILRPLLVLAAYAIPNAGDEIAAVSGAGHINSGAPRFHRELSAESGYPLCLFQRGPYGSRQVNGGAKGVNAAVEGSRVIIRAARSTAAAALKRAMMAASVSSAENGRSRDKRRRRGRSEVLDWIKVVVRKNEAIVHVLESELLSPGGTNGQCSSRSFLLGTASSVLSLCCRDLVERFEKRDASERSGLFDVRYLMDTGDRADGTDSSALGILPGERRLLSSDIEDLTTEMISSSTPSKIAGGTELFFLTGGLLRVALFSGMRVEEEFNRKHESVFAAMKKVANDLSPQSLPDKGANVPDQFRRTTGAHLGWSTVLLDEEFVFVMTEFALLQLRWLVSVANGHGTHQGNPITVMRVIPEWMCKLPAQWIAYVATRAPRLLKPHQGEEAVRCATHLLRLGSGAVDRGKNNIITRSYQMSPPVLTQLTRIAGAFVRAGINRARQRELAKKKRRQRPQQQRNDEDDVHHDVILDDRELNIYLSFDANDLGVTVFTNRFVSIELCPALMKLFTIMDAVEGMDVEKEHHFHKNQVKSEIAELILRLWAHPSGECRASVSQLDTADIARFTSSVAAELGMSLDNAYHGLSNLRSLLGGRPPTELDSRDRRNYDFKAKHVTGGLAASRRLLLLLTCISEDDRIASILGGKGHNFTVCQDIAGVLVHLIDQLSVEDGGTHPDLDLRRSKIPTSKLVTRLPGMSQEEKASTIKDLLEARSFVFSEVGLDVSVVSHWLLALAARCHLAARQDNKSTKIADAILSNEDFNILHWKNIFSRLIPTQNVRVTANAGSAMNIFKCDGHVNTHIVSGADVPVRVALANNRATRATASQDQMSHSRIDILVSVNDMSTFLEDLALVAIRRERSSVIETKEIDTDITVLERKVLNSENSLSEEDYKESLRNWAVFSESFLSPTDDGSYAHSYNSNAQARGCEGMGSGRIMFKEARKCHKNIPHPHPNTSIFVCFDEDRMDLCRAIIVGAIDTPYSLGLFEFDIYFPPAYPLVSPLVTFKTTGGGTVRFSPNLYTDGKVCISILGTTEAWNKTQRWNPEDSSLVHVLMSIQTQILGVTEPFFNEGFGHENMRGSRAGEEGAKRYDTILRLATLRHAIIAQMKRPPVGFEEVSRKHFSMCRSRLLVQARRWGADAKGTAMYPRFRRAYKDLLVLLSSDKFQYMGGGRHENAEVQGALLPLTNDLHSLEKLDPQFMASVDLLSTVEKVPVATSVADESTKGFGEISKMGIAVNMNGGNTKLSASNDALQSPGSNDFNPWANVIEGQKDSKHNENEQNTGKKKTDCNDDYDEELYK